MCDLLQIADAIRCICDLVSDMVLWPFTRSMRYRVAICCAMWCGTRNLTLNRICDLVQKKIESDSCRTPICRYSKSHLRFSANRTWNRTQNRSRNQPLNHLHHTSNSCLFQICYREQGAPLEDGHRDGWQREAQEPPRQLPERGSGLSESLISPPRRWPGFAPRSRPDLPLVMEN
jgi:hypothetical protein